jgi:hypothetical protein
MSSKHCSRGYMIDDSRYARLIFNHFSKRDTISEDDISHFGDVVRKRLAQIPSTNAGYGQDAEHAAFEAEFAAFREAPAAYLAKLKPAAEPAAAPALARPETESAPSNSPPVLTLPTPVPPQPAASRSMMPYLAGTVAAIGVLCLAAVLMAGRCGMPLSGCADSGWLPAQSNSSNTLTFTHGLGPTPRQVSLFYKHRLEDDVSYPVIRSWAHDDTGNPVTVSLTGMDVVLNIVGGLPIHGTWSPSGSWRKQKQGFFRIVVMR